MTFIGLMASATMISSQWSPRGQFTRWRPNPYSEFSHATTLGVAIASNSGINSQKEDACCNFVIVTTFKRIECPTLMIQSSNKIRCVKLADSFPVTPSFKDQKEWSSQERKREE